MSKALPIQLIYASTSGNVETVVEKVAEVLQAQGYQPTLHRAEQTSLEVIERHQTFILATSTWEHGALNPFFVELHKQMKQADFAGKRAAFIGLGDRRYEPILFCEGMEILKRTWTSRQGGEIIDPLRIQGEPYALLDTLVVPWALKLSQALSQSQQGGSLVQRIRRWFAHD